MVFLTSKYCGIQTATQDTSMKLKKLLKKQGNDNDMGKFYILHVIRKRHKYIYHIVDIFLILKML